MQARVPGSLPRDRLGGIDVDAIVKSAEQMSERVSAALQPSGRDEASAKRIEELLARIEALENELAELRARRISALADDCLARAAAGHRPAGSLRVETTEHAHGRQETGFLETLAPPAGTAQAKDGTVTAEPGSPAGAGRAFGETLRARVGFLMGALGPFDPPMKHVALSSLLLALHAGTPHAPVSTVATSEEVKIYYDNSMVPHVFGQTDEGAMFGLAYHHMLDFPVATLNALWFASGRMAEIAGPCYLPRDKEMLLWEVPHIADRQEAEMLASDEDEVSDKHIYGMLEAYVAGIEAGRAWWRDHLSAGQALFEGSKLHVDPVPAYLNPDFGPFKDELNPAIPIGRVFSRLFSTSMPVTVDHVLRLGVVMNSGPTRLYRNNEKNPCSAEFSAPGPLPDNASGSNGWLFRHPDGPILHSAPHVRWYGLTGRMLFAQIAGSATSPDSYKAFGLSLPGHPMILAGFNDRLAWGSTASPVLFVAENKWAVTLLPPAPGGLKYTFTNGVTTVQHKLTKVDTVLNCYDPTTNMPSQVTYTRYYAPEPNTALGLPNNRYPVTSPDSIAGDLPVPGGSVTFEQAAFTVEGSPYEYLLRVGLTGAVSDLDAVFDRARIHFSGVNNLYFADSSGHMRYVLLGRFPVLPASVLAALQADPTLVLDGHQAGQRWTGFHPWSSLPQIDPEDPPPVGEAWIVNNCSPDGILHALPGTQPPLSTLTGSPSAIVWNDTGISTWRQERATELFFDLLVPLTREESEAVGIDKADIWMHEMWAYFELAESLAPSGQGGLRDEFMTWMNGHRNLDENDEIVSDPRHDFIAHKYSQAAVWGSILRRYYLEQLESLDPGNSFGIDPVHPLFGQDLAEFTQPSYSVNRDAMVWSLDEIVSAGAWSQADDTFASWRSFLAGWSGCIETQDDPWGAEAWEATRWGHANLLCLTPHGLPLKAARFIPPSEDCLAITHIEQVLRLFESTCPSHVPGSCPGLELGEYSHHRPVVFPIGGTDASLFSQARAEIGAGNYLDSLYEGPNGELMYYHPVDQGTSVLFNVQLRPGQPAVGRFLAVTGSTEITRAPPESPIHSELAYQDRFAPTQAFVDGTWQEAITVQDELVLGTPAHTVLYTDAHP